MNLIKFAYSSLTYQRLLETHELTLKKDTTMKLKLSEMKPGMKFKYGVGTDHVIFIGKDYSRIGYIGWGIDNKKWLGWTYDPEFEVHPKSIYLGLRVRHKLSGDVKEVYKVDLSFDGADVEHNGCYFLDLDYTSTASFWSLYEPVKEPRTVTMAEVCEKFGEEVVVAKES